MRILIVAATSIGDCSGRREAPSVRRDGPRLKTYTHAGARRRRADHRRRHGGDGRVVLARAGRDAVRPGAELRRLRQLRPRARSRRRRARGVRPHRRAGRRGRRGVPHDPRSSSLPARARRSPIRRRRPTAALRDASAVTASREHGARQRSIDRGGDARASQPQVESMEGARSCTPA